MINYMERLADQVLTALLADRSLSHRADKTLESGVLITLITTSIVMMVIVSLPFLNITGERRDQFIWTTADLAAPV